MRKPLRNEKTPRILFVTPVSPFTKASGAEQRSHLMLSALGSVGVVDVLQLRQDTQFQVSKEIRNDCNSVIALLQASKSPFSRYEPKAEFTHDIESMLGCKLSDYQLIVGRYVWPVCQLAIPNSVPVIADLDDFRYRYSAATPWSWALLKERAAKSIAHRLIRQQLQRFSGAFTVSEQDRREVTDLPTAFLPNVPMHSQANPTPVPPSKNIVFVGSLWYRPNKDGIDWFLKHVWPHVHAQEPDATLTLAGAAPPTLRANWETHAGVSAKGFAPDLAALYQYANLVIVPVQSGGGTNIKVLEAMAYGRPCLASSFVASAFGSQFIDAKAILVAKNAQEFCEKILAALRTQKNIQDVADAGYVEVRQSFTHSQFKSCVADFVHTAIMNSTPTNDRATKP